MTALHSTVDLSDFKLLYHPARNSIVVWNEEPIKTTPGLMKEKKISFNNNLFFSKNFYQNLKVRNSFQESLSKIQTKNIFFESKIFMYKDFR